MCHFIFIVMCKNILISPNLTKRVFISYRLFYNWILMSIEYLAVFYQQRKEKKNKGVPYVTGNFFF